MKKWFRFSMLTVTLLASVLLVQAQNVPFIVENNNPGTEAVRIQGANTYLSFYDGSSFHGFLQNYYGDILLGTSQPNSTGKLRFYTQALERMTILPNGWVGIGTTWPSYPLHVVTSDDIAIYSQSTSLYGVQGRSVESIGVFGLSENNRGILGQSTYIGAMGLTTLSSTNIDRQAIRGDNHGSATGWAGYFLGNVHVSGTLSKGAGSFKIDHPLDPENKYLYHSFVESPDMKNLYDGIVTTDASGDAEIVLPDWFMALNRDFRYQLTVINQFAQAIISQEIINGSFSVKTSVPNVKVSWQVTGTRQDPYAEQHRIPVEENKPSEAVGKYLHPDVYGQPREKAVDYQKEILTSEK